MLSVLMNGTKPSYGIMEFSVDTSAEVATLPTYPAVGSLAFCIEDSKTYMLNGSKQWVEVKLNSLYTSGAGSTSSGGSGSSSGGSQTDPTEPEDEEPIDHIIYDGGLEE